MQFPIIWSNEVSLYNKTQKKSGSQREEDLTDQSQDPQSLHDNARREERGVISSPEHPSLTPDKMGFHSFFFDVTK